MIDDVLEAIVVATYPPLPERQHIPNNSPKGCFNYQSTQKFHFTEICFVYFFTITVVLFFTTI